MRHLPHDPRFRALLVTALALAGCGNKADPEAPADAPADPRPELTEPGSLDDPQSCEKSTGPAIGSDLQPAEAVDATGLVVQPRQGRGGMELRIEPAVGTLCADSTTSCLADLLGEDGLRNECHQIGCFDVSLAWSRGGTPGIAKDRESLLAFLGPVDAKGDARTLVWAEGFQPTSCEPTRDDAGVWTVNATKMVSDCPIQVDAYDFTISPDGVVTQVAHRPGEATNMCIGRLPPGLTAMLPVDETVGSWLARAAHLEAASVAAFEHLHRELVHHGAPQELCEAALACAADEVRHAALVGDLAVAAGAEVPEPVIRPTPIRSLVAIARDNAAEGCGREAWGALVGLWQATHAEGSEVRRVMASVAADEIRHAEFSLALDAWLRSQLTATEVARVDRTLHKAHRRLAAEAQLAVAEPVRRALGLPRPAEAATLWRTLAA